MMKLDEKNLITLERPYDFRSESGDRFHFDFFDWPEILGLACRYGWRPTGTLKHYWSCPGKNCKECSSWDQMEYAAQAFQWFTEEDAAKMADALERALEEFQIIDFIKFCRKGAFSVKKLVSN